MSEAAENDSVAASPTHLTFRREPQEDSGEAGGSQAGVGSRVGNTTACSLGVVSLTSKVCPSRCTEPWAGLRPRRTFHWRRPRTGASPPNMTTQLNLRSDHPGRQLSGETLCHPPSLLIGQFLSHVLYHDLEDTRISLSPESVLVRYPA